MSAIGKIREYDQDIEEWSIYVERLKLFLKCNNIKPANQVATVLTLIGSRTYTILRNLLIPELPESKDLEEICNVLTTHFQPIPFVQTERFKFQQRQQFENEGINDFAVGLKRLTLNCKFENSLDERLRDQFIFGLKNASIQQRLLTEIDLSFNKAIAFAISFEMAKKDSLVLNASQGFDQNSVHHLSSRETKLSPPGSRDTSSTFKKCCHCGKSTHLETFCRFKEAKCFSCGKIGHLRSICKRNTEQESAKRVTNKGSFPGRKSRSVNAVSRDKIGNVEVKELSNQNALLCQQDNVDYKNAGNFLSLYGISDSIDKPVEIILRVNNRAISFELDTGAAVTILPIKIFKENFADSKLLPTEVRLKTYTGQVLIPLGKLIVTVCFKNKIVEKLELFVMNAGKKALLGRPWIFGLGILDSVIKDDFVLHCDAETMQTKRLDALINKHAAVFQDSLGEFKDIEAHLSLKENSVPKFFKARPVPFALKPQIEEELKKLQRQGVITPINSSDWASPIVAIVKKDKSLRICGDYKVGLNPALIIDHYPLPNIEEMFCQIKNGAFFTKLDLAQAYQQMRIDETSKRVTTINTHMGLFQVNRLPFGVASSPAIFQKAMDQVLTGLPGVMCYLDDILCSGETLEEHFKNLDLLLSRLNEAGIHLKKSKCEFFKDKIEYLGHIIDHKGLRPSISKIADAAEAHAPQDVGQLCAFLGLVSYYRKFLPNLASSLAPFYKLLEKNQKWEWTPTLNDLFEQVKKNIISPQVLIRFKPDLPVSLACDASAYGLGAVISHILPDGSDRPIAFASRTLSKTEKKYAQIDREALGIIFGLKKFHQYLYGRKFTLLTDHKPLIRIFGPNTAIPTLAAARLQRWALILAAYDYEIIFRKSQDHANADVWSRLPCNKVVKISEEEIPWDILYTDIMEDFPVDSKAISKFTTKDPILSQIRQFAVCGWPLESSSKDISVYLSKKDEISILQDCLLWGNRVIVPKCLRTKVLRELHKAHVGIVKMKMLARSYFWWPGLDEDINQTAKACEQCMLQSNNPARAPLHPWTWPTKPWQRIHIDFAGPFRGETFLVAVDAHSKWPEVHNMKSTSTHKTIEVLHAWFARFGLPEHIVSDNGTQFTSTEFKNFCKFYGIRHSRSAPYHPSTNGQAERFVQILKRDLKKKPPDISFELRINQLLFSYRNTPHLTTHETPAKLFLKRQVRTVLDLLRPSTEIQVNKDQDVQTLKNRRSVRKGQLSIGQTVMARAYQKGEKWRAGTIVEQSGPISFKVKLPSGEIWNRHLDQIIPSVLEAQETVPVSKPEVPNGMQKAITVPRRSQRIKAFPVR